MADAHTPWRALRPLLFAGAAAVGWLTLSSTAASADALSDTSSLLGGVTSSVSATVSSVTGTPAGAAPAEAPAPPAPQPAPAKPAGLLQPVAGQVAAVADKLTASVPVVEHVVPRGSVATLTAPVAKAADAATKTVVEAVVAPVAEAVPVLEPVLVPLSDLVTGAEPLPLPDPPATLPQQDLPSAPAVPAPAPALGVAEPQPDASTAPAASADAVNSDPVNAAPVTPVYGADPFSRAFGPAGLADTAGTDRILAPAPQKDHQDPAGPDPVQNPAQAPAVPGTGTGSAGSSGAAPGSAAWLSTFDFECFLPRAVLAREDHEHTPSPVSFDPGSSPD